MTAFPTMSFETKTLDALKFAVQHRLSRYALSQSIDIDTMLHEITNSLVMKLEATILSDPERSAVERRTITYEDAHPNWKYQLVSELPERSFLRRWAAKFWDVPEDYSKTRVTHVFKVDVKTIFPENTMVYPEHLGRPHYYTNVSFDTNKEPYFVA